MAPACPRKKIVVIGDGCTGKTALIMTYVQKTFPVDYMPTVFENYTITPQYKVGKRVELSLWDTAGQEDYDRLRPLSYPDTDLVMVCFSLAGDNKASFHNVAAKWYPEARHFCPGVPMVLVGTKEDLRGESPYDAVTHAEGVELASKIKAAAYYETSAKKWTLPQMEEFFATVAGLAVKERRRSRVGRVKGCVQM